jgi:hypothetical protein
MAYNPYSINPQPTYKGHDDRGHITPNFEYSEGIRPAGSFMPAPYLPQVRFNEYFKEAVVLSAGKVVAFDSNGFIVPAGLALQAAAWQTEALATDVATADAITSLTRYTADDVKRKVKNAAGVLVVNNEPVVKSFFDQTTPFAALTTVSAPIGVAPYNYWPHPGGDGENPALYNVSNWNLQNKVAFLTRYQLEYPLVEDRATYLNAPFSGIAAFVASAGDVKPGGYVTFDTESNVSYVGYTFGSVPASNIIGQVTAVSGPGPYGYLERVRTSATGPGGVLDAMPGTATAGLPDVVTYSGGYGIARILLQK